MKANEARITYHSGAFGLIIRILFSIAVVMLICQSCTEDSVNNKNLLEVNIKKAPSAYIWEASKSIELIPLETNLNSFIARIGHQLLLKRDTFIVRDAMNSSILFFSQSGKYLDKIANDGTGPVDIGRITDMEINPFTGNLDILSPDGRFFTYNFQSQTVRRSFILPEVRSVHYFVNLTEDIVAFYSEFYDYKLYIYSRERKEITERLIPNPDKEGKVRMGLTVSPFYRTNDQVRLVYSFDYTIYNVTPTGLTPFLKLDFGRYNLNANEVPPSSGDDVFSFKRYQDENSTVYPIISYFEDDDKVLCSVSYGNNNFRTIWYEKSDQSYRFLKVPFEGKFLPLLAFDGKNHYGVVVNYLAKDKVFSKNILDQSNKGIFDRVDEDDNPLIIKYQLVEKLKD